MVLILRRPADPGFTRDRLFIRAQVGGSRLAVAVSKDEDHCHDQTSSFETRYALLRTRF
jgi:hypothetical protein